MKCNGSECLNCSHCEILGQCMLEHYLVQPYAEQFKKMVLSVPERKRPKRIVRIFQALKPEKVNVYQLNRYFGFKMYQHIDLDKPGVDKKILKQQQWFGIIQAAEDRNKILKELMGLPDDTSKKKMKQVVKNMKRIVKKQSNINPVWS